MSLKMRDTSGLLYDVASNVSVDSMVSSTSRNAIQSKAVYQALQGKIDRTVGDLINYYAKSQVYTKTEIDALLSAVTTLSLTVVAELPTSDISSNTIYLVGPATGTNMYDEYVRVDNTWIKIGDTDIDLSSYVTNSALELAISDFLTESDVQTLLADYYSKTDIDTMFDYYYTSTEVDNLLDDKADASSLGTAAAKNAPTSGNASTFEVVLGSDTRLTDDRNAADVYAWAKEQYKPTYDADEISYDNTDSGLTATDVRAAIDETQEVIADSAETIFKVMGENGAKNLLPTPYAMTKGGTYIYSGLTWTENADGSLTASGTNTSSSMQGFNFILEYDASNFVGKEIVVSIKNAPNNADAYCPIIFYDGNNSIVERHDIDSEHPSYTFTVPLTAATCAFQIYVRVGKGVNATVYPMIRLATDSDDTYEPYAKTNRQLTEDKAEQAEVNDIVNVLGAKNLLPNQALEDTWKGIAWKVNSDGTLSASGTATENSIRTIVEAFEIPVGKYILNGCPSGSGYSTYYLNFSVESGTVTPNGGNDIGEGLAFEVTQTAKITVKARVLSGQTVNIAFKPMIRLTSITDDTYEPYAKTNRELTENVEELNDFEQLPSDLITANDSSVITNLSVINSYKYGHIAIVNFEFRSTSANLAVNTTYMTIKDGFRPKSFVNATLTNSTSGKAVLIGVWTTTGNIQIQGNPPLQNETVRGSLVYFI